MTNKNTKVPEHVLDVAHLNFTVLNNTTLFTKRDFILSTIQDCLINDILYFYLGTYIFMSFHTVE